MKMSGGKPTKYGQQWPFLLSLSHRKGRGKPCFPRAVRQNVKEHRKINAELEAAG